MPLSKERVRAARAFIERSARPLDRALVSSRLGETSTEAALEALAGFQNPDGGFGRGLEPDIQSSASSAIATSIGLRLLARLGAPGDHPMVAAVMRWLSGALDAERGVWPIVPEAIEDAPHAPWWTWSEDLAVPWNGFRLNPTAEILAWLYRWPDAAPAAMVATVEAGLRQTLEDASRIEGAYDLKCAARLAEAPGAPADIAEATKALVISSWATHDPADEHIAPFDIAPAPSSVFAATVADRTQPALAELAAQQQEDGGWIPFWDWSFVDAAAWDRARGDWRGWLTREALETLAAWGEAPGL
jgi:hypothetical protein